MGDFRGDEIPVLDFSWAQNSLEASLVVLELLEVAGDFVLLLPVQYGALIQRIRAVALEGESGVLGEAFDAKVTWCGRHMLVAVGAKFRFQNELKRRLPSRSIEGACWCNNQSSPALPRVSVSPFPRKT